MKDFIIRKIFILLCMLSAGPVALAGELDFDMPEVKKFKTMGGVKSFYIKDELPRTTIFVTVGYGRLYENSSNAGTGELLARMIKTGGTKNYPGNRLFSTLEEIGGEIAVYSGWENMVISIKVLTRHADLAFSVLKEILEKPRLNQDDFRNSKKYLRGKIKRDMDNPEIRAFTKAREIIFAGAGYGSVLSKDSLEKMSLEQVRSVWSKHVVSGNINIAVSSSMEAGSVKKKIERAVSNVPRGKRIYYSTDMKKANANVSKNSGRVYLIPMKLKQATIVKGAVAPAINYDGRYALKVMNYILGGGSFTSRLMSEIRIKRGLSYSVGSVIRNRYRTGVFLSYAQTRNKNAVKVLKIFDQTFKDIYTEKIAPEELNSAISSISNSFLFRFTKTGQIVSNFLDLEYNGFDESYYNRYLSMIKEVDPEAVRRESEKIFQKGTVTVVVGDRSLSKELSKYAEVVIVE